MTSMASQSVAWSINSRNEVSLIYEKHQGPPILGDSRVIDISYSASEMVFIIINRDGQTYLEYGKNVIPSNWQELTVLLPSEVSVLKIDASPGDKAYLVLSDKTLAMIPKPEGASVKPEIIAGSEGVVQVSAAPDETVWTVVHDVSGSLVRYLNPGSDNWQTIDGLNNAVRVAGTKDGKAYVINSDGSIALYSKDGKKQEIACEFRATELSVGPDGTLWAIGRVSDSALGKVFTTKDQGVSWQEIADADARYLDAGMLSQA